MKKMLALILCGMISLSIVGCTGDGGDKKVEDTSKVIQADDAENSNTKPTKETESKMPETEEASQKEETSQKDESSQKTENVVSDIDYSEAFGSILNEFTSMYGDAASYALYDIDKDGIKEMIVSYGTCEADWHNDVFSYNRGTASFVGSFCSHVMLYTAEDGNGLYAVSAKMGFQSINRITIEEGMLYETTMVSEEKVGEDGDYYSNDQPVNMAPTSEVSLLD